MAVLERLRWVDMASMDLVIRPAAPADADLLADLVYLTMGVEADWLFGQEPGFSTHQVLAALCRLRNNRVSYHFAHIAALDGQDVGLLLAFPGRIIKSLDWVTGLHLARIFGLLATIRVARCQAAYGALTVEAEADEFYISNLAVSPQWQGLGVGQALMVYAEQLARESNLQKCSLIVTYGHEPARRLYEKLGYQIVRSFDIAHPKVAEGSGGYHRMVKVLSSC